MNNCSDCNESNVLEEIAWRLLPTPLVVRRCSSSFGAESCNLRFVVDSRHFRQSRAQFYWPSWDGPTGDQSSQTVQIGPTEIEEPFAQLNHAINELPPLFIVLVIE